MRNKGEVQNKITIKLKLDIPTVNNQQHKFIIERSSVELTSQSCSVDLLFFKCIFISGKLDFTVDIVLP